MGLLLIPSEYHSLGKPLKPEEYQLLAAKITEGGWFWYKNKVRALDIDSVNAVVLGYTKNAMLTAAHAAPRDNNPSTIELALMVGITALVEATHRWAMKSRDNQIRPYLKSMVRGAVDTYFRREYKRKELTWDVPAKIERCVKFDLFDKVALDWVDKQIIHYRSQQYSHEEVGNKLGITRTSVTRRLSRMKRRYREIYESD